MIYQTEGNIGLAKHSVIRPRKPWVIALCLQYNWTSPWVAAADDVNTIQWNRSRRLWSAASGHV